MPARPFPPPSLRPSRGWLPLPLPQRERNLLGTAFDWQSNARPASFDDVRQRHQALPANQLARVTAQYLRQQQAGAAAGNNNDASGGAGAVGGPAGGSSSGTAIVVKDSAAPPTGPGLPSSLLSRVEPFGYDREANEVCFHPRTPRCRFSHVQHICRDMMCIFLGARSMATRVCWRKME